jgi:teichuronic acid biosynthesis glycosyltransferase TuaG
MVKISVILPAYNAEKYITQTLDSIKRQTVRPDEIIIVNDCSTDNTFHTAYQWGLQNRIQLSCRKNLVNSGIGYTRSKGVEYSSGDYITFLSADDCWHPQFIEKCLPYLNEKTAVFTDYYQCDQYLKPFNIYKAPNTNIREKIIEFALQKNMFVNFSNVIFPTNIFKECSFEGELRHGEDLIFLLDTIIEGLEYCHVAEPLSYYRIHPTQGSNLRGLDEWSKLWDYLEVALTMLDVPEETIMASKKRNYDVLYPKQTLTLSAKRVISKLLSKNKHGLKFKAKIKNFL